MASELNSGGKFESMLLRQRYGDQAPVEQSETINSQHVAQQPKAPPHVGRPISGEDIYPLEAARGRFLQILVDHFFIGHCVPARLPPHSDTLQVYQDTAKLESSDYPADKSAKKRRKFEQNRRHLQMIQEAQAQGKVSYEGDPNYLLPLIYAANMYETLIAETNARLNENPELAGKSVGLALEASGGLYRRLVEKFPKTGGTLWYKRREVASEQEARDKFPELMHNDEKRTRFVVVQGVEVVENPTTLPPQDAEWFKLLTGRTEACVCARDYKFYSARLKPRRPNQSDSSSLQHTMHMMPSVTGELRAKRMHDVAGLGTQRMSPPRQTSHPPPLHHSPSPHATSARSLSLQHHLMHPSSETTSMHSLSLQASHTYSSSPLHLSLPSASPQPLMPYMPSTIAKFCDECGAQYLRETSRYCSGCGTQRPGS